MGEMLQFLIGLIATAVFLFVVLAFPITMLVLVTKVLRRQGETHRLLQQVSTEVSLHDRMLRFLNDNLKTRESTGGAASSMSESPAAVSADTASASSQQKRELPAGAPLLADIVSKTETSLNQTPPREPARDERGFLLDPESEELAKLRCLITPSASLGASVKSPDTYKPVAPLTPSESAETRSPSELASVAAYSASNDSIPDAMPRTESAAMRALRRIGTWLVVGEEDRPQGVSLEFAIASTWLLRLGVIILVMAIGFFLKYSIDKGLLPPIGRVAVALIAGSSMIAAGLRLMGARYHAFAQGLIGGGLATLYFAVYAAHHFYGLIDTVPAFVLMVCVTAGAVGMAVGFNSLLIAMLGLIGGYATPVMLGEVEVNFVPLLAYLGVLGYGTLAIAYYKQWRLLTLASFIGTYSIFLMALRSYQPENFYEVMPFAVAFFLLFAYASFLFHLRTGLKSTVLEVLALIANASIFFAVSYNLVEERFGRMAVSAVTIPLAFFHLANAMVFLKRKCLDRDLLVTFIGGAAFFAAVTLPLVLSGEWLTVSWSIQALVMLWIAAKIDSAFLRHLALLLYLIVATRFLVLELPGQYLHAAAVDQALTTTEFLLRLVERFVAFGVPIASFALAVRTLGVRATGSFMVDRANDTAEIIRKQPTWGLLLAAALLTGVTFAHLEVSRIALFGFPVFQPVALTALWAVVVIFAVLTVIGLNLPATQLRPTVAILGLIVVVMKLLLGDLPGWMQPGQLRFSGEWTLLASVVRSLDFVLVIALAIFVYWRLNASSFEQVVRRYFLATAIGLTWLYLTCETGTVLHTYVPGMRHGGISVLWAMFGLALLIGGISSRLAEVRYAGLLLFTVVVFKIFLVDLARLDTFYRIIAFVMLGVLVMAASFLYLTFRSSFAIGVDPNLRTDHGLDENNEASPMIDKERAE